MANVKQLKDDDYGATTFNTAISINLEGLWNVNPEEDSFIKNYSKVVLHEHLHSQIAEIVFGLYDTYEEFYVATISGTNHLSMPETKDKYLWQLL